MTPTELASELDILAEHNAESALLRSASHALRRLGRVEAALVGFVDCACDVCLEHSAIVECPHVVKMHAALGAG